MADAKIYLNVPYAEKDAAKALGAKWDAVNKKWYVTGNTALEPFAKWQSNTIDLAVTKTTSKPAKAAPAKPNLSSANTTAGVFTYASIKDFVAYDGEEPPWK